MTTLTVDSRFCGPPGTANGGYAAGLMAQQSAEKVRIRLERPIPVDVPLELERIDGALTLTHAGLVLARGHAADLELDVPAAPSYLQALEASRHFPGFSEHPCPGCFVCGTERARGDGLRIFAGRYGDDERVAAPWVPDAELSDGAGKVRPEFMSAVLDCPGAFARAGVVPMLLGEFAAHIDRCVHVDEPCVVIGWQISLRGRKFEAGTALFDEDLELCARARATWIELKPAR
ncbi:MAG TPA: hypothetical protein VGH84_06550 [Steroidobacteraceae bacterium]|jgi:hypothetical protein